MEDKHRQRHLTLATSTKQKVFSVAYYVASLIFFLLILILISIGNHSPASHAIINSEGSSGTSPETQAEIDEAVEKFYSYQIIKGCRDEFKKADQKMGTVDNYVTLYENMPYQESVDEYGVKVETNMYVPSGASYVVDITAESTKDSTKAYCSSELLQPALDNIGSDLQLDEKIKDAAGSSGRCETTSQNDDTCFNPIKGVQIKGMLDVVLRQFEKDYSYDALTDPEKFEVYRRAFDPCVDDGGEGEGCGGSGPQFLEATEGVNDDTVDDTYWIIDGAVTNSDGEMENKTLYAKKCNAEIDWGGDGGNDWVEHFVYPGNQDPQRGNVGWITTAKFGGGYNMTCPDIKEKLTIYFPAYVKALAAAGEEVNVDTLTQQAASSTSSTDEEDPCQAGFLGFGWLFCPGANLIESFMNGFLNWIDDQLNWTMLAENDGAIRERWQDFLNIANIAFAIAFLVMIYSMATSTGLSNYDIKKMLPRLIVVAIAVNLSFYICAAIVDIFNIVGNSIYGIIVPGGDKWAVSDVDLLFDLFSNVVALIGVLFIFGISAIVALVVIFVCLCVREIALITLVVISPLAFVCYLLPNTQKWFQRWADYFIRLLMVYPMFMAVWGAAKWVASLKGDVTTGSDDAMPGFVVNFTCMIAPAIAIIPLFKMSGGIMGMAASRAAGSKLAARGQAAQGYMRNRGKQAYHNSMIGRGIDRHRERAKDLDKQVNEGSYTGYNPLRRARQAINRGVNKIPVIGGAKGVSSDKDLGNFLKNYTYVDGDGNVQHLTDDQMLDYVQGRAAKDADGHIVLAAQNLNAEQIGSGIKALSGDALEDVYGKTTTSGAPVAATDASKRYAHLQATSNMHEIYAKHGIDIGKDTDNAYRQMREIARSGEYTDKSGKIQTVSSEAQGDIAAMLSRFDANAGSADAEKIFNEEAETFRTKRQFSAIKTTVSGFTDAAAKRESDEISQALGSAMKAREFKKNAFKSGASTPPSS